ncbi:alpha/beta hydrolase [Bacillus cabrialesii]|uniref:alpha/beta fold hydrolase n=1 Tax=Bacillus cabrialesii TaxID=2487276 RepID=UPI00115F68EF
MKVWVRNGLNEKIIGKILHKKKGIATVQHLHQTPDTIKNQYLDGTQNNQVSPDGYTLDIAYMSRPGIDEKQLDLIFDYKNNVKLYPAFQQYLREYQPPLLATWGKNDVSFIPQGALAFKKDVPNSEIHLLDSGHFALETHVDEIGRLILNFMEK